MNRRERRFKGKRKKDTLVKKQISGAIESLVDACVRSGRSDQAFAIANMCDSEEETAACLSRIVEVSVACGDAQGFLQAQARLLQIEPPSIKDGAVTAHSEQWIALCVSGGFVWNAAALAKAARPSHLLEQHEADRVFDNWCQRKIYRVDPVTDAILFAQVLRPNGMLTLDDLDALARMDVVRDECASVLYEHIAQTQPESEAKNVLLVMLRLKGADPLRLRTARARNESVGKKNDQQLRALDAVDEARKLYGERVLTIAECEGLYRAHNLSQAAVDDTVQEFISTYDDLDSAIMIARLGASPNIIDSLLSEEFLKGSDTHVPWILETLSLTQAQQNEVMEWALQIGSLRLAKAASEYNLGRPLHFKEIEHVIDRLFSASNITDWAENLRNPIDGAKCSTSDKIDYLKQYYMEYGWIEDLQAIALVSGIPLSKMEVDALVHRGEDVHEKYEAALLGASEAVMREVMDLVWSEAKDPFKIEDPESMLRALGKACTSCNLCAVDIERLASIRIDRDLIKLIRDFGASEQTRLRVVRKLLSHIEIMDPEQYKAFLQICLELQHIPTTTLNALIADCIEDRLVDYAVRLAKRFRSGKKITDAEVELAIQRLEEDD